MHSTTNTIQQPDARFWLFHLWIPLLVISGALYLFEHSSLDIAFADFIYRLEGGNWIFRKHWFTYDVMHHWGKQILILFGLIIITLYFASFKIKRLYPWRWSLGLTVLSIILIPSFVAELKHISGVPCPWHLDQYGGTLPYLHSFQYISGLSANVGKCFPSGHSSGGFALFAVYFAFWPFIRKNRYLLLLPGLLVGISFGLAQQVRGAHFISHDLWTAAICWFGGLLFLQISLLINPPRKRLSTEPIKHES